MVYDATVYFCNRFIDKRSRTYDQMVQAARSGKQNIAEGSIASGTSKDTEIKLTGVAKASQKELLEDYRDFMRNHSISEWPGTHAYARRLSKLSRAPGANYQTFNKGIEHPDPAICANVIVGLIKLTHYLLERQLQRLARDFLKEGGLRRANDAQPPGGTSIRALSRYTPCHLVQNPFPQCGIPGVIDQARIQHGQAEEHRPPFGAAKCCL